MTKRSPESERKRLRELIEEATVDCYGEEEELTGLLTMIQDNVACPFHAKVIGEEVTVTGFEWPGHSRSLFAVCRRNKNCLLYTSPSPRDS